MKNSQKDIIATSTKRANFGMIKEILSTKDAFQNLVNDSYNFTAIITVEGRIIWGNYKAATWLKVPHDVLHKEFLTKLFDERTWETFHENLIEISLNPSESIEIHTQLHIHDDQREISWSIQQVNFISDKRGPVFQVVANDVSILLATTRAKSRLEAELVTAQIIQKQFLPPPEIEFDNVRVSSFYQPAEECSGDWWCCFQIDEFHTLLCVADVMGHGAASAMVTAMTHATYLSFALDCKKGSRAFKLRDLIESINSTVYESFHDAQQLTFFGIVVDSRSLEYTACIAGHNNPYAISASGESRKIGSSSVQCSTLGYDRDSEFNEFSGKFEPGERLVLFTDGLFESRNSANKPYGLHHFSSSLKRNHNQSTPAFRDHVISEAFDFFDSRPPADDITLIVAEFKA